MTSTWSLAASQTRMSSRFGSNRWTRLTLVTPGVVGGPGGRAPLRSNVTGGGRGEGNMLIGLCGIRLYGICGREIHSYHALDTGQPWDRLTADLVAQRRIVETLRYPVAEGLIVERNQAPDGALRFAVKHSIVHGG